MLLELNGNPGQTFQLKQNLQQLLPQALLEHICKHTTLPDSWNRKYLRESDLVLSIGDAGLGAAGGVGARRHGCFAGERFHFFGNLGFGWCATCGSGIDRVLKTAQPSATNMQTQHGTCVSFFS